MADLTERELTSEVRKQRAIAFLLEGRPVFHFDVGEIATRGARFSRISSAGWEWETVDAFAERLVRAIEGES